MYGNGKRRRVCLFVCLFALFMKIQASEWSMSRLFVFCSQCSQHIIKYYYFTTRVRSHKLPWRWQCKWRSRLFICTETVSGVSRAHSDIQMTIITSIGCFYIYIVIPRGYQSLKYARRTKTPQFTLRDSHLMQLWTYCSGYMPYFSAIHEDVDGVRFHPSTSKECVLILFL